MATVAVAAIQQESLNPRWVEMTSFKPDSSRKLCSLSASRLTEMLSSRPGVGVELINQLLMEKKKNFDKPTYTLRLSQNKYLLDLRF